MSKVYQGVCPCLGCELRDADCHCPNGCHKGDNLYQKWKATGVEIPPAFHTNKPKVPKTGGWETKRIRHVSCYIKR